MSENTENKPKKGITKLEIMAVCLIAFFMVLYFLPKVMVSGEKRQNAILRVSAAAYTSKTLEAFALAPKKPDTKAIAKKIIIELNEHTKNPIDRSHEAFVSDGPCPGCINVEPDPAMGSIIVTGYDKNLKVVVRTVIKPPSFVVYEREDD